MLKKACVLATLVFTLACGGSVDVSKAMSGYCDDGVQAPAVELVEFSGPAPTLSLHVVLSMEEIRVDGMVIPAGDLLESLRRKAEMADELGAIVDNFDVNRQLLVSVDANIDATTLVPILQTALDAGFPKITFIGQSDQARQLADFLDAPYGTALMAELDGLPPSQKATQLAEEMEGLVAMCPPAQRAFAAVGTAAPEMKCPLLVAGMEEALPSCPLTDGAKVVTALQVMTRPRLHPLTTLTVELDPEATPIPLAPATLWRNIAPTLLDAKQPIWLALEPS